VFIVLLFLREPPSCAVKSPDEQVVAGGSSTTGQGMDEGEREARQN
jgi:hypothetical protein